MDKSITLERITNLMEESMFGISDEGICIACGEDAYGIEPDAERYECEGCGEKKVFGAESLLYMVM